MVGGFVEQRSEKKDQFEGPDFAISRYFADCDSLRAVGLRKSIFYLNFGWRHLNLGLKEKLWGRKERGMSGKEWCWMEQLLVEQGGGCWGLG